MATKDYTDLPLKQRLAWVAGIIDGEGCFGAAIREIRPGHTIRQIRFSVPQCHPEMLERLLETLEVGIIRKRKPPTNPKHSQRWDYKVTGFPNVSHVVQVTWPWLGSVKRAQATEAIKLWESSPRKTYLRSA